MNRTMEEELREWAKQQEPTETERERLVRKVHLRAAHAAYPDSLVPGVIPWWTRIWYAALGALAALAVASFYHNSVLASQPTPPGNGPVESFAQIPPHRLAERRELFARLEQTFDERLRWVSESRGYIGVGVDDGQQTTPPADPMLVRLVLVTSRKGADIWRPVWHADVMVRGGELVQVMPNEDVGNELKLLVYERRDGRLTVGSRVFLEAPVRFASRILELVEPAAPSMVFQVQRGNQEYRLVQSVQPLRL